MPNERPTFDDPFLESILQQTEAAVEHWTARARDILGLSAKQLPLPEIRYDLRGRVAGQAVMARRRGGQDSIRINGSMLAAHTRAMVDETVPHEVAHIAIHRRFNSGGAKRVRPHGPEWKALMTAFGVSADTCHNLPAQPSRRLRRFAYACGCPETVWLTSIRHHRALKGTVYQCKRCGQRLRYQVSAPG